MWFFTLFDSLHTLIWLPILVGSGLFASKWFFSHNNLTYGASVLASLLTTVASVVIVFNLAPGFENTLISHADWAHWGLFQYHLSADGLSLVFVVLNNIITLLVLLYAYSHEKGNIRYLGLLLCLQGLVNGVFLSGDLLLFYVFWEASLIPIVLIIGIWGGENRVFASVKFFIYTFLGSLLMLIAIIFIWNQTNNLSLAFLKQHIVFDSTAQLFLFAGFFIAMAIKIPIWPLHTWLPYAHVQAPTGGSIVLAGILLKLGGYGLLRINLPLFPEASIFFAPAIVGISLVAIIFISILALMQNDMKKMIAYSSVSHMGFVTLGIFVGLLAPNPNALSLGISGGVIQMVSHGFISAGLFLFIGILYQKTHTKDIDQYGGVAPLMPWLTACSVFLLLANSGLPGTSGFVGEFLVILSSIQSNVWIGALAATTLVTTAGYNLWLAKRVFYGPTKKNLKHQLTEITKVEKGIFCVLIACIVVIGFYPNILQQILEPSIQKLLLIYL